MLKDKLVAKAIDFAKRNKYIQSIFEKPIELEKLPIFEEFKDSHGNIHKLYEGLRSKIKKGWENAFATADTQIGFSKENIQKKINNGRIAVDRIEPIINTFSKEIKDSVILDIGCHNGASTFAFAEKSAIEVIGTEFSGYKISSTQKGEIQTNELQSINSELEQIRNLLKPEFINSGAVKFADDNICNSGLPDNYFDIIASWDVLEHLNNPAEAFKNMHRILKPGGIAVHDYNPFFSLSGGHSASTIDFPWGHVILNTADFEKYCNQIQPQRKEKAMSFFINGLNRMTIADMKKYAAEAGLQLKAFLPFTKEQHLRTVNDTILEMCLKNYRTADLSDLVTPRIIIVLQK